MARPLIHPLSTFSVTGSDTRYPTRPPEPSPSAPSTSTVLGPLAIHQLQDHHQPQFQYLPEYDWTPASTSLQYLPLFNPTDQQPPPPLPLPAFSRPFSSNGPMSHTPFPLSLSLPGARMLTNHPDGSPATATASQPSIDADRPPSAPPPSIRRSSRSHLKSGERGSDRDSTGDDPDTIEDVPAAVVADPSVSRIRRTWASVYEDDVLTSDESVPSFLSLCRLDYHLLIVDAPSRTLPAAKRRRIYILSLERYINVIQYCLERNNMVVVVASASGRE